MERHNARIARSGIQYYLDSELPGLMLKSIPREYYGWRVFAVYRPSYILEQMSKKFQDVPVRIHHKWVDNLSDSDIIGKVKDNIEIKHLKDEVVLQASLEIKDGVQLPRFDELSPGYVSTNIWKSGKTPSGEEFQILCTGINEVNHLAIVEEARGGEDMKILDGGRKMAKIHSGLIHAIRKRINGVKDGNDPNSFDGIIDGVKNDISKLTSDELTKKSEQLISLCDSLPDSEQKDKLKRYLADIPLLKAEDKKVCDEALNLIKESYKTLDSDAVAELMKEKHEEQKAEHKEGGDEKDKDKEKKDEKAATNDEDPMKRMCDALDGLSQKIDKLLGDDKKEEGKTQDNKPNPDNKEKKDENKVTDSLPPYTQSLAAIEKGNSLEDVFNHLKGRK